MSKSLEKAVEFAGYMATAAEHYLAASDAFAAAAIEEDSEGMDATREARADAYRALRSAIYEFRKRVP